MSIATIIMSTMSTTTIIKVADLEDITVVDIMAGIIKRQFNTADILWMVCWFY